MLSATPIPRTLAMSYLADLDVSVIDELPPGRTPVVTKLVSTARRDEVLERVRGEVAQGRQAYWVCPLVEDSDALDTPVDLTAAFALPTEQEHGANQHWKFASLGRMAGSIRMSA